MTQKRNGMIAALVAGLVLASFHDAGATTDDVQAQCRHAIQTELQHWTARSLAVRQRCQTRSILGLQAPDTDCSGSATDSVVRRRLDRVDERLQRQILRGCDGADFTLLSYPGPCPDQPGIFDGDDLVACIRSVGGAALDQVLDAYLPAPGVHRGSERACLAGVGGRGRGMLQLDVAARLQCSFALEQGTLPENADCLAKPPSYGEGTGSEQHDDLILRAYMYWLSAMPPACARVDLDELGYGTGCDHEGATDLHELRRCIFDANVHAAYALVDLAFPSDPVCGNGILQEGEACDDGQANSDTTPDACRADCTHPRCSDGVTDQGETCDDGNLTALDGCNALCQAEFCGDGITNDNPPEQCDDGNAVTTDLCASCRNAVCGDGFVCTSAACTSGPTGGVEQCDDGVDNGPANACQSDCSGFRYTCQVTFGVTSNELLGGVTYQVDYPNAPGTLLGSGNTVRCTSLIQGALSSFFDNDNTRRLRHSVILPAGFQAPLGLGRCSFATNDAGLAAASFALTLVDASNPDFEPRQPALAVTSIVCE